MKRVVVLLILSTIANTNASANFKQTISVCLIKPPESHHVEMYAQFKSTDFFDLGFRTHYGCTNHTYQQGPKNITISFYNYEKQWQILFDQSCHLFIESRNSSYDSLTYTHRATWAEENYTFTATPTSPNDGRYKKAYLISCNQL